MILYNLPYAVWSAWFEYPELLWHILNPHNHVHVYQNVKNGSLYRRVPHVGHQEIYSGKKWHFQRPYC